MVLPLDVQPQRVRVKLGEGEPLYGSPPHPWIAADVAKDLASQNVLYAEVFYPPGDYRRIGAA